MRILKYELEITDIQRIPLGTSDIRPLSVAEQNGKLMMWAEVEESYFPEGFKADMFVQIIGTGNPYDRGVAARENFIGTVVMSYGLVWHVFAWVGYPEYSMKGAGMLEI